MSAHDPSTHNPFEHSECQLSTRNDNCRGWGVLIATWRSPNYSEASNQSHKTASADTNRR